MIGNFCLDILNSELIQRVGREKRRGAVEDVDNSIYETGPGTNILKVHLISNSRCALHVSVILGKPEVHPIFGAKKLFKNITRQILNFILKS